MSFLLIHLGHSSDRQGDSNRQDSSVRSRQESRPTPSPTTRPTPRPASRTRPRSASRGRPSAVRSPLRSTRHDVIIAPAYEGPKTTILETRGRPSTRKSFKEPQSRKASAVGRPEGLWSRRGVQLVSTSLPRPRYPTRSLALVDHLWLDRPPRRCDQSSLIWDPWFLFQEWVDAKISYDRLDIF